MGGRPEPVRVALLTYRGNPRSGGQGVYVRRLSKALARLGHQVEVLSGPPYPEVDPGVRLTRLPSLDLYRPEAPFRPVRRVSAAVDLLELGTMCLGGFPEPLTFSLRAWAELRRRSREFDVVHDNQCLAYGLLGIRREGLPVLATVHHPIQVDRRVELAHATGGRRWALRRWYGFTRMQGRVARRLPLLTVSAAARDEIVREMGVSAASIAVVPNGVDAAQFRPMPERRRTPGRIVATASADVPLKGLDPLLRAFAILRARRPAELVVIGRPRPDGPTPKLLDELGLHDSVRFVSGIPDEELIAIYAEAEVAVVPSLYEGFSLPAVEAMACGLPLVATTAGALPEVVGADGDAALLVPPGDPCALADALTRLLADAALRRDLGERGRARVLRRFTWESTAMATAARYREVIAGRC
ncbi:MAG TPA: glycosyltransferase family 4 protein [Candidatus Dormibacteraeota bacterium]